MLGDSKGTATYFGMDPGFNQIWLKRVHSGLEGPISWSDPYCQFSPLLIRGKVASQSLIDPSKDLIRMRATFATLRPPLDSGKIKIFPTLGGKADFKNICAIFNLK